MDVYSHVSRPEGRDATRRRSGLCHGRGRVAEPVVGAPHPLLQLPHLLCTPHLGYAERGSYAALYSVAVDQLLAFAAGTPINIANPEAVGKR